MNTNEELINEILSILKQNNLPSENTIYDRRDTAVYIQQLIDQFYGVENERENTIEDLQDEISDLDDKNSGLEDKINDLEDEIENLKSESER